MRWLVAVLAIALMACQTAPKDDFQPAPEAESPFGETPAHVQTPSAVNLQPAGPLAHIDQVDYYTQLKVLRPDLIEQDCRNNLLLRPKYRQSVLTGADSYQQIAEREYDAKMRKADEVWAQGFRLAATTQRKNLQEALKKAGIDEKKNHQSDPAYAEVLAARPFYVSDDDISGSAIGYHLGAPVFYDAQGLSPKVFIAFRSPVTDLTPALFEEFMQKLAQGGFIGDVKVTLAPGATRFQFNNIVVHSATPAAALTAEALAQNFFAAKLEALGRGFDVAKNRSGQGAQDWNTYLCTVGPTKLSPDVLAFAASQGDGEGISITPDPDDAEDDIVDE